MKASFTTTVVVAGGVGLRQRSSSKQRVRLRRRNSHLATLMAVRRPVPASGGSPGRQTRRLPLENGLLVVYAMARTRPSALMRASNASTNARRSAGP